ncbi:hypothetical protein Thermus77420_10580 [Thermus thalpophilus]|uniref:Uncharacterized protein n=1 Tax=Thermus brockianus TaxID=56956 RepID=A0ABM7XJV9_THEBO|nr:hypothetical protein TbrSNM41_13460 [Thermus brockianus]
MAAPSPLPLSEDLEPERDLLPLKPRLEGYAGISLSSDPEVRLPPYAGGGHPRGVASEPPGKPLEAYRDPRGVASRTGKRRA